MLFFVVCGYYLSKGPKLHTNGVHKYEMANYVAASKSVVGSQGTIYICRLFVRYIAIIGTPPASQCLEDHKGFERRIVLLYMGQVTVT